MTCCPGAPRSEYRPARAARAQRPCGKLDILVSHSNQWSPAKQLRATASSNCATSWPRCRHAPCGQLIPHTDRLAEIATRVRYRGRPVPGLTTHQAKGREWEVVEVRLDANEREALAAGLNVRVESHRQLYVACTRARRATKAAS